MTLHRGEQIFRTCSTEAAIDLLKLMNEIADFLARGRTSSSITVVSAATEGSAGINTAFCRGWMEKWARAIGGHGEVPPTCCPPCLCRDERLASRQVRQVTAEFKTAAVCQASARPNWALLLPRRVNGLNPCRCRGRIQFHRAAKSTVPVSIPSSRLTPGSVAKVSDRLPPWGLSRSIAHTPREAA